MSDASSFDFSKFVPGFDFLKKLSGTGASAGLPSASSWIAPTLDPDELDKRIQELKTVHFWLDQNTKAVSATIQALEVQKMTLATLRGMNMSMTELAESLKIQPDALASVFTRPEDSTPSAAAAGPSAGSAPATDKAPPRAAPKVKRPATRKARTGSDASASSPAASDAGAAATGVDPMAWWGSLTQQFQHIAHQAMNDLKRHEPPASTAAAPQKAAAAKSGASASARRSAKSKPARKSGRSTPRSTDT
jgi:hypothetical protein